MGWTTFPCGFLAVRKEAIMLPNRTTAKNYLKHTDKETFFNILYKAKISPRQKQILILRLLDRQPYEFISSAVFITEDMINKDIAEAYDLIYHYLFINNLIPKPNHSLV